MSDLKILRIHLICWSLFIGYELLVSYTFQGYLSSGYDIAGHYLLNIGIFYTHYIILECSFSDNGRFYKKSILLIILSLLGYLILKYLLYRLLIHLQILKPDMLKDMGKFVMSGLWRALYFMGLSTGYWFAMARSKKDKIITELENLRLKGVLEKEGLEKKLLIAENSFLKAQINPHFLFNILGFIHNEVAGISPASGEMIIILSDMMRYALSKQQEDNMVQLSSEIEYIENYIRINQYRFRNRLNLQFSYMGNIETIRILPLLLVTIFENIFKYGDLSDPAHPAVISLEAKADFILFNLKNKKNNLRNMNGYGIGMKNVISRLNMRYGNAYELKIEEREDQYYLKLLIPIEK
jgi:two-component system LytT family sensor kinase